MTERRLWSVDIDGKPYINESDLNQFRITFDVAISPGNAFSTADIRIYNLKKDSQITSGQAIKLRAGYTNAVDTIFTGVVTNVFREREGASVITRLTCRSGTSTRDRGSLNSSYSPGATLIDVLKDIASSWPRRLSIDESQFEGVVFTGGYMVDGDIPQELDKLAYAYKFDWTQNNGALYITKQGAERSTPVKKVSAATGMIGFPEISGGSSGINVWVAMRLDPYVTVNSRIEIESELSTFNTGNVFVTPVAGDVRANGIWNIIDLRYRGDSHGNQFLVEANAQRANSAPSVSSNGKLAWGAVMDQDLRKAFREVAEKLGTDPNWLTSVVAFETGRTFSPYEKNKAGSGAVGLIQFIPSTARSLGYTTAQLARMSAVEQLEGPVYEYFKPYKNRLTSLGNTYLAVFYPAALGRGDDYVIATSPSSTYTQNAGLDVARKGYITAGDTVARVERSYREGQNHAA